MFYCQKCNNLSSPGESSTKVVTKTRKTQYINEDAFGEKIYSEGWEIVEEQTQCVPCSEEQQ
jgi:hypothetical protein